MQRLTIHLRLAAVLAVVVALGALWAPGTAAQGDTFEFPITKLDCEANPGMVDPLLLEVEGLPAGCTYGVGQTFTVTAEDGTTLGSCTTPAGPPPTCYVTVPAPSTVTVTEDVSTAALGYAPRQNPITVTIEPNTEAGALFVNLPVQLPETGTGTAADTLDRGSAAVVLGALSLLLAGAGGIKRRQVAQDRVAARFRRPDA